MTCFTRSPALLPSVSKGKVLLTESLFYFLVDIVITMDYYNKCSKERKEVIKMTDGKKIMVREDADKDATLETLLAQYKKAKAAVDEVKKIADDKRETIMKRMIALEVETYDSKTGRVTYQPEHIMTSISSKLVREKYPDILPEVETERRVKASVKITRI